MVNTVLFVLGLCFGSFVNALVWRLHEQSKQKKSKKELSVLRGRSMCVHCHHPLAWYDLLPVVSWLALGGKCRYCKKPISWQYPVVELATAGLFLISYVFWPYEFDTLGVVLFVYWLAFLVGFMAMIVYDLRWMLLPNKLTYSFTILAGSQVVTHALIAEDFGVVFGAIGGLASVGGLFYVLFQLSGGTWIGGGDVKLGFLIGLLAGGFVEGLLLVFIASLLGSLVSVPILINNRRNLKRRIPFGPFLIVATIIVYLFGADMIVWYQDQLLLS